MNSLLVVVATGMVAAAMVFCGDGGGDDGGNGGGLRPCHASHCRPDGPVEEQAAPSRSHRRTAVDRVMPAAPAAESIAAPDVRHGTVNPGTRGSRLQPVLLTRFFVDLRLG